MTVDLTDKETFQNAFLLCSFAGFVAYFVLRYGFKKRGIDVYSRKIKAILLLTILVPALVLIWVLPDLPSFVKLGITILGIVTEFVYYYALDKASKRVRQRMGVENEEDRYEREKEEKGKQGGG